MWYLCTFSTDITDPHPPLFQLLNISLEARQCRFLCRRHGTDFPAAGQFHGLLAMVKIIALDAP